MHYPRKLHDGDFEFPILCEQTISPNDKTKKLMSTFYDKENYKISFINLQYCLKKELKLKKVHHVTYAKQIDFMKSDINFNNEKRIKYSKK